MDKNFYITTPIYYPSAKPHMGHAYSSIIADFFARFKKMDDFNVYFLTGTDEHGLKIQRAAEKQNIDTLKFCDQISQTFRDLSKTLNLMVQPDSELRFQFSDTLRDVSLTSKSLKRLAELLERNPQAFLIGKPSNSKE